MISILDNFFIIIGEIVLSTISFLKNISFKNILKRNEENGKDLTRIFSKLNFEPDKKTPKNEDPIDKIRDKLMPIMLKKSFMKIIIALSIILLVILPLELFGIFLISIAMVYILLIYYP